MSLNECNIVYFLGIGGIGMSALARYFLRMGARVHGYDRTSNAFTAGLEAEGMIIHYEENVDLIPDGIDLVIYTPAIPKESKELKYCFEKKFPVRKRAEVLGMITMDYNTLAVAGTHGKTTTSSLVAHILITAGVDMIAFLGGISKNYSSNFLAPPVIPGHEMRLRKGKGYAVAEADEYDRSFLQLYPHVAIVTSMDDDHMDIYKSSADMKKAFREFSSQIQQGGTLILKKGLPLESSKELGVSSRTYALKKGSDYYPENIRKVNDHFEFDLVTPAGVMEGVTLGLPGRFNLENAIAAAALAIEIGVGEMDIREALKTFKGVKRRFDYQIRRDDFIYIDDYAHHPQEISACIRAVRELYPEKRISGVFQPHLYSRTRDFLDSFASSLEQLDELILLDIYPARETPIPGVNSRLLLDRVNLERKMLCTSRDFLPGLKSLNPEVLLTMGAGDIDQWTDKIVQLFNKKEQSLT